MSTGGASSSVLTSFVPLMNAFFVSFLRQKTKNAVKNLMKILRKTKNWDDQKGKMKLSFFLHLEKSLKNAENCTCCITKSSEFEENSPLMALQSKMFCYGFHPQGVLYSICKGRTLNWCAQFKILY